MKCWDCGSTRRTDNSPCWMCGAPPLKSSRLEFECASCGKQKVGERVVKVTEDGIQTICAGCLVGTDADGAAPRLKPPRKKKERAA